MITKEMVYDEKRRFVKKLEEALLMLDNVRAVEYGVLEGKGDGPDLELVRIDWHGESDPHAYVDVTFNSLGATLKEIASMICGSSAIGLIMHAEAEGFDELWKEAESWFES